MIENNRHIEMPKPDGLFTGKIGEKKF